MVEFNMVLNGVQQPESYVAFYSNVEHVTYKLHAGLSVFSTWQNCRKVIARY